MGFGGEKTHDGDVVGDAGLSGGKPCQHRLGTAASKTRRNIDYVARPQGHAHPSPHASSITTVHNGYGELRVPPRCSCHACRTGATRTNPSDASRVGASSDSAHSRKGPRSQASIGTPKPIFGRSISDLGT